MDETFGTFPYHICANDGRIVMRGERIICTAVSDGDAGRIALALNLAFISRPLVDASGVSTWAWGDAYKESH